jgi:hypothetical protein
MANLARMFAPERPHDAANRRAGAAHSVRAAIWRFVLAGLLSGASLLVLCAGSGHAAASKPVERPARISASSILWGAWVGNAFGTEPAPWDMSTLSTLTADVSKAPAIVHFYQDFENCAPGCTLTPFPARYMTGIRKDGSIPMLSWASMASIPGVDTQKLSLASIASGQLDGYLRQFARAAKRWGHPFFLRFDWEMNVVTGGFPWGVSMPGNSPAEYIAAYRHVHDVFGAVGAHNMTWVWCPLAQSGASVRALRRAYPGNAYVDWTCLDAYNWGTTQQWAKWSSFNSLMGSSYAALRKIAPSKPVMVGEFGSTEYGGSKAAWLRNALAEIPRRFSAIRAILYFDDYSDGMDWPLNSSASAQQAFRTGISSSVYASNTFTRLGGSGPILPQSSG